MNIEQAFTYAKENETWRNDGIHIIGVAYTPNDPDGDFHFVKLNYSVDAESYSYSADMSGGNILDYSGTDGIYVGDNIEELLTDAPEFISKIKYSLHYSYNDIIGNVAEYALKGLFPSLPNTEDLDLGGSSEADFKKKAIKLITDRNYF